MFVQEEINKMIFDFSNTICAGAQIVLKINR